MLYFIIRSIRNAMSAEISDSLLPALSGRSVEHLNDC